ncbi:family 20 glycosylhydrolase [Micromonospora yasonensis]|uniref:family 20 glycosylhydrolase n=1 Tax=Micromonospora yasonensis TaxID=1128667 RepID=UPI0029F49E73|nr:family 20 glycosylhydrolase [Micromonospora yasonensis]
MIPEPTSMSIEPGRSFQVTARTSVVVDGSEEALAIGEYLAELLRPATGYAVPTSRFNETPAAHAIMLRITDDDGSFGPEAYRLDVTPGMVLLQAATAQGLFHGVQTLRQLLPAQVEADSVQSGPWRIPGVHVVDQPRYAWRAAMLDPARHFLTVAEVKRYIELLALYKMNTLHLHLADDQGWRIQIDSWPRLATYGGSTEVGGGPGGYYTKDDYREIVAYAAKHQITVVPEIDMPGHTNAALASYAELNCNGVAPKLYTGTGVGFSSLCIDKPITYQFIDDVIRELAAMTPGSYLHIGGDEAHVTPHDDYVRFIDRVEDIVNRHGKTMIGWEEISAADTAPPTVAQYWSTPAEAKAAADKGMEVIMSPAQKAYLDMKYDPSTPLGLSWAGYTDVRDGYEWDPGSFVTGLDESKIRGVEAPLWGETIEDIDDVEFMTFPRIPGVAERGWSTAAGRSWDEYRLRLGAHGPRWDLMSVNYYRSPQVPWGEPAPVAVATDDQVLYEPDGSARVTVTVTNRSTGSLSDLAVALAVPDSSEVQPAVRHLEVLPAGQTQQLTFDISFAQAGARAAESATTVTWQAPVPGDVRLRSPLRLSCAEDATSPVAVTYADSQETVGENGAATNTIDGDPNTIWHTQWRDSSPGYPHEIQVDLGAASSVCAFRYLPRQNGVNGTVDRYEVYLSADGHTWGQPIASGRFGTTGQGEKWVPLPETGARYVRFVALSEINGRPWAAAAEISADMR